MLEGPLISHIFMHSINNIKKLNKTLLKKTFIIFEYKKEKAKGYL